LTLQEVEVEIKLRPLGGIVVKNETGVPNPLSARILKVSMPVEYVFLQDDEKNYYKSHKLEQSITQLQMHTETIPPDIGEFQIRLPFINPVKELYMVIQNKSNVALDQNDWFNYTNNGKPQLKSLQLDFNNETYINPDVADDLFLRILQPMNRHTRVPSIYVYNYSFALDPENFRPTGQVNMSRIQNKLLTINLNESISQEREVRIYAKSYNILRVEHGLGGVLFIDNNYY